MRNTLPFVLILSCLAFPASAVEAAVPFPASQDTLDVSAKQTTAPKVTITPHRALYEMGLASAKNGSNIGGVSGQLLFEWADACDGWAIQQHIMLHFTYAEGDESNVNTSESSWEAKDGSRYNFNIRRVQDGKETEMYRGKATMGADGGIVVYTLPANKKMDLPAGTLFPSAHTTQILQKAQAGEKLFFRRIFDGSDEEGINDISAFIGTKAITKTDSALSSKLANNPLLTKQDWPVRMAFFKTKEGTGEPDYELDLDLLANGIVRTMKIDYGDFAVQGTLKEIEELPSAGCGGAEKG